MGDGVNFGLLHGLGFAGALADIGLPQEDLWLSLLLFNVGIEAGQLGVIALLSIAAWVLSRLNMQSLFTDPRAGSWDVWRLLDDRPNSPLILIFDNGFD